MNKINKALVLNFLLSSYTPKTFTVPKIFYFNVEEWCKNKENIINNINSNFSSFVAVRSSAHNEDNLHSSNAGKFKSFLNINPKATLILEKAIENVIESYNINNELAKEDNILIQEMVQNIAFSGVAFSCDLETLAPYFTINYTRSGNAEEITNGTSTDSEAFIYYKNSPYEVEDESLKKVVESIKELITVFKNDYIDIEFAITDKGVLNILQVRPIVTLNKQPYSSLNLERMLSKLEKKITKLQAKHYDLLGETTMFGVMPDWNPAEIIGIKPKPLAISLYQELITNRVWAENRYSYGYRNVISNPLMTSFFGIPFIDVRVDLNSWIPSNINKNTAEKLINYYLKKLKLNPEYHDKIEFYIVFTCFTFSTPSKLECLLEENFSEAEVSEIATSLLSITTNAIKNIQNDIQLYQNLELKRSMIMTSEMQDISKIYCLVEEVKKYGIYPFAGLARSAFIAVDILNSLIEKQIITTAEKEKFIQSLNTISGQFKKDIHTLEKEDFLNKYGHLRPSTYDITSLNYREGFDFYFASNTKESIDNKDSEEKESFEFSDNQKNDIKRYLQEMNFRVSAEELIEFLKVAICEREYSKFIFTKSVNEILELVKKLGLKYGATIPDLAYLEIQTVLQMYYNLENKEVRNIFLRNIQENKEVYKTSTLPIKLPYNIFDKKDIYMYHQEKFKSNFITNKKIIAETLVFKTCLDYNMLKNKIVAIENADPGYDFIFTKNIAGLITKFGGINSHMAIRCSELGIPASIGVGEASFNKYCGAKALSIDCEKNSITIIN